MKSIIRNFLFVLKRFATSSILIFLGLTGAMVVFIVCMIQVEYDFNYNRSFKRHEDIFMGVINDTKEDRQSYLFNTKIPEEIANSSIYIEDYTTYYCYPTLCEIPNHTKLVSIKHIKVLPSFVNMFNPKVLLGDVYKTLNSQSSIIISENTALKAFGKIDVIGESLIIKNSSVVDSEVQKELYTIGAVISDFSKNSFIDNGVYSLQATEDSSEFSYKSFFLFNHKHKAIIEKGLADILQNNKDFFVENSGIELKNIVNSYVSNKRGVTIWGLILVAVITLLLAYINFINFSLLLSPLRQKTLSIQHILGLTRQNQRVVLSMELVLFTLLAYTLACLMVAFLSTMNLSTLFIAPISIKGNLHLILCLGGILLFISLLLGLCIAQYTTACKANGHPIKEQVVLFNRKSTRNILMIFQIFVSCVLPIITVFISLQYSYLINYSWGIDKENIAYFNTSNQHNQSYDLLKNRLLQNTNIVDITTARFTFGNISMESSGEWKGEDIYLFLWPVEPNFLNFFGIEVVKGENFPSLEDGTERAIVNQKFVDKFFPYKNIIGESLPGLDDDILISGIAKDINFSSLHGDIEPMAFVTMPNINKGYIFLKLAKGINLSETIEWITKEINTSSIEPIEVKFLDEQLDSLYSSEKKQAEMITIFCVIIILITLMGVYGLINFNVKYREKEIALRKINGADEKDILKLLNRDLIIQFIIGFTLSIPMAYYISLSWISQFAYRISLSWWVFALCGFAILLFILITVSVQSYKAAIKNPVESLKSE